ncbi:hypothetical protein AB0J40_45525 [Amycolatopsis sp. NPDC049691]|uniref:hypothetical protein n=1 Tax=Amycolatopsis sp. NPDC049691 TaxID=3155155 RepID=UPI00342B0781
MRNKIEHRFESGLLIATAAHAHALVINFEAEQRRIRRGISVAASAYITTFEGALDQSVRDDERFVYRIQLTPMKGSWSDADLAVTFVREDELSETDLARIRGQSKTGTVVVAEKLRDVALKDEMLPAQATQAIADQLPFKFSRSDFIKLRKAHGVRPAKGQPPERTDPRYCVCSAPYRNYVYTPAYVRRCVSELDTAEKFRSVLGKEPEPREKDSSVPMAS